MMSNDRRFGFSVVGGVGEGVPPRVDDIQPGRAPTGFITTALLFRAYYKNAFYNSVAVETLLQAYFYRFVYF